MEENEIIERIDKFFDKEGLDIQGKYFLTKKMNEEYWREIEGEGEEERDIQVAQTAIGEGKGEGRGREKEEEKAEAGDEAIVGQ